MVNLSGLVCLVTGASRGIGRGIAIGLGESGATVYLTGRSTSAETNSLGGSLQETAATIEAKGGKAIPVAVDHSDAKQVHQLFDQIRREQNGRLDLLVNNAYAAVPYLLEHEDKKFYDIEHKSPEDVWDLVNNVGLRNSYICASLAARMMIDYSKVQKSSDTDQVCENKRDGLIINISSVGGKMYLFNAAYGIGKAAIDRMSKDMARDLKSSGAKISIFSLWPGLVQTEAMKEGLKTKEESYRLLSTPSESPELSGRVVATLAGESVDYSMSRTGQIIIVSDVANEYGLLDIDGSAPLCLRSMKYVLKSDRYFISRFVPSFLRIPKSVVFSILESK